MCNSIPRCAIGTGRRDCVTFQMSSLFHAFVFFVSWIIHRKIKCIFNAKLAGLQASRLTRQESERESPTVLLSWTYVHFSPHGFSFTYMYRSVRELIYVMGYTMQHSLQPRGGGGGGGTGTFLVLPSMTSIFLTKGKCHLRCRNRPDCLGENNTAPSTPSASRVPLELFDKLYIQCVIYAATIFFWLLATVWHLIGRQQGFRTGNVTAWNGRVAPENNAGGTPFIPPRSAKSDFQVAPIKIANTRPNQRAAPNNVTKLSPHQVKPSGVSF